MSARPIPYESAILPTPARFIRCHAPHPSQPVLCTRRADHTAQHQGWLADGETAPEDMVPIVWDAALRLETHRSTGAAG